MTSTQTLGYSEGDGRPLSRQVLDAIAEEEGTDPLSFETPLFEVVDPDALNALFPHAGVDGTIEFAYRGHRVTVHSDGRIELGALGD